MNAEHTPDGLEHRDLELARRFADDPVPGSGVGFWDDLDAALTDEPIPGRFGAVGAGRPAVAVDGTAGEAGGGSGGVAWLDRGWGPGRWLSVAAAVVVVAGLGGLVLMSQGRSPSPIESASPTSPAVDGDDRALDDGPEASADQATGAASTFTTTTLPAPASTATTVSAGGPQPSGGTVVDYFTGDATVAGIGTGRAVGFSPDDSAVLMVDAAPGDGLGCEAAPLLALYAQDLASGRRVPALGPGSTIETGGLDLVISPFGRAAVGVETRPVYWTDWCDGQRHSTHRGLLAADGTISLVEEVDPASDNDPFFAGSPARGRVAGIGSGPWLSPDGTHQLSLDDGVAAVSEVPEVGQDSGQGDGSVMVLVGDEGEGRPRFEVARWSPSGDAVALVAEHSVWLWSPWTGESEEFDASNVVDLVFDTSGRRLAVTTWNPLLDPMAEVDDDAPVGGGKRSAEQGRAQAGALGISVLTFEGLPDPAPALDRCSGRSIVDSVDADELTSAGVPTEVVATAVALDRAAAVCDWAALAELIGDDFTASFGGGDPIDLWQEGEANGSPMWYLRTVLGLPWTVDGDRVVWPSVFLRPDCDWTVEDYRSMEALGFDRQEAREACESFGGYAHHRVGIDSDGSWRFFVAGD